MAEMSKKGEAVRLVKHNLVARALTKMWQGRVLAFSKWTRVLAGRGSFEERRDSNLEEKFKSRFK